MKTMIVTFAVLWILMCLAACGSTTGWQIGMGVYPVDAVMDQKTLNQRDTVSKWAEPRKTSSNWADYAGPKKNEDRRY